MRDLNLCLSRTSKSKVTRGIVPVPSIMQDYVHFNLQGRVCILRYKKHATPRQRQLMLISNRIMCASAISAIFGSRSI